MALVYLVFGTCVTLGAVLSSHIFLVRRKVIGRDIKKKREIRTRRKIRRIRKIKKRRKRRRAGPTMTNVRYLFEFDSFTE